jgi:hypothetical protein
MGQGQPYDPNGHVKATHPNFLQKDPFKSTPRNSLIALRSVLSLNNPQNYSEIKFLMKG